MASRVRRLGLGMRSLCLFGWVVRRACLEGLGSLCSIVSVEYDNLAITTNLEDEDRSIAGDHSGDQGIQETQQVPDIQIGVDSVCRTEAGGDETSTPPRATHSPVWL